MKNNNGFFSMGAYQWALAEMQKYRRGEPCTIDMAATLKSIKSGGHDVKISMFEHPLDKKADVILMLEWVGIHKEKIDLYTIHQDHYTELKRDFSDCINIFKMNGRIRYQEELNAGRAQLPVIVLSR